LKGGAKKNRAVKYILIDEAQDMCKLQHRIIRMIFPESRYAVLADVNQALYPMINVTDKNFLYDIYSDGGKPPAAVELTVSYRQTFEISRFASNILNIFSEENYFKRHGDEPEIVETDDTEGTIVSLIKSINERGYASIGILTRHRHEAESLHKRLNPRTDIALIVTPDAKFTPGAVVMPVAYAKGLEFDAVIVPDYKTLKASGDKRVLYLMCTRALHLLYLIGGR